jgi:hypothetical protein
MKKAGTHAGRGGAQRHRQAAGANAAGANDGTAAGDMVEVRCDR